MLYTFNKNSFKHQVHPSLRRRIKIFLILSVIMLAVVVYDMVAGSLSFEWAFLSLVLGSLVGLASSRIFHLSWNHDGNHVVARIDKIGWLVLAAYIVFEMVRASLVQAWLPESATAITFAFIASALMCRVFGLRGRIIKVLKEQKIR